MAKSRQGGGPLACVLGNMDLVRALGLGGIKSAAVTRPGGAIDRSRFTTERIEWADHWQDPEALLENLIGYARSAPEPPPLFFQHDGDLSFVSENRDALGEHFRFAIADAELVERCVDKTQFTSLAERLGLPIPPSETLWPAIQPDRPQIGLELPLILKPITRRDDWWRPLAGDAKALRIDSYEQLERVWPVLAEAGVDLVAQQMIPGGEQRIESYHGYVDPSGEFAAEFTGRKIRTFPADFGNTTACEITDVGDVLELGRECMRKLGLVGVAKLDFKRDPQGGLHLLEVNPRFTLWHLPGAVAGVNIPAVVYADLVERPRPPIGPVKPGVRYSLPWTDLRAVRADGSSLVRWAIWLAGCETRHVIALDDPMAFLGGVVWKRLRDRVRRG